MANVLVIDDERSMREFLQLLLERDGHVATVAADVRGAIAACERETPAVVFADLKLPDGTGLDVLRWLRAHRPETQVIMMTAYGSTDNVVEAMRLGAYDYQSKPVKVDEVRALTEKALEKYRLIQDNRRLSERLRNRYGLSRLLGRSQRMVEVVELIERVAPSKANVLVEGESGTGKELVARAVHEGSRRASGPFVAVNCGAIPEQLIEAELFGHAAGAFTGAAKARSGLFEAAHGGTILLDEVSELPAAVQVKLLRVIQERSARRVGDESERPVDVRVVACTNRDLMQCVQEGSFREDLFYRLNVIRIRVPPLRERVEDIPLLTQAFLVKYAEQTGAAVKSLDDDAMQALCAFPFPGNVRELENCIERAVALAESERISLADLPSEMRHGRSGSAFDTLQLPDGGLDLESTLRHIERQLIEQALRRADGVKTRAADLLGLTFRSLRYRLRKLGLAGDE